jgi:hypothetical protein
MTPARLKKTALAGLVLLLLVVASFTQRSLNQDRIALGVTRGEALGTTAPPALVFTTVALGGFRGLIANALWVRAMDLQDEDKFFEKVQLADWITKLQPRFVSVWIVQAWDMAYNISVKFNSPADRWLWVQRGIELLRDQALKYNPDEPLIYRELAWLFQHKMGADLDDAHFYYKSAWREEMQSVLNGTNYTALIHPKTEDELRRARILRERYKLDPEVMLEIDEEYGPLEWRLPESHAVYWATMGFKKSKRKDLITLRRTIYQPLQLAFRRGRLLEFRTPDGVEYQLAPNLAMIPSADRAYLRMAEEDPEMRDHILRAHRNFLKDAVYFLYTHNRQAEATQWWSYLLQQYPDALFTDVRKDALDNTRLADIPLDDYVAAKITEDIAETSRDRMTSNLIGLLVSSFFYLANDLDDEALGHERLAQVGWARFQRETKAPKQQERVGLDPYDDLKRQALLIFTENYHPDLVARLYTRLGLPLPSPAAPPPAPTNPQRGGASDPGPGGGSPGSLRE